MAKTSAQVIQSIQKMGQMPDYKTQVTKKYDSTVLRPLVDEAANLEQGFLPAVFDPFTRMGTGAADMSPAAKLSGLASSVGRWNSRMGANNAMQNYYGAQIDNIVGSLNDAWKTKLANKWQMANFLAQQEQAAAARAAAQQNQIDWSKYFNRGGGGGGGNTVDTNPNVYDIDAMGNRIQSGLSNIANNPALQKVLPSLKLGGGLAAGMIPAFRGIAAPMLASGTMDIFGLSNR